MATVTVSRRPASAWVAVGVLAFLGISAVPSGIAMLIGGTDVFPRAWVDAFPLIGSLVAPGLVLLLGFGVGALVTAYGVLYRPCWPVLALVERLTGQHWSWLATLLLGLGQLAWIGLEGGYLGWVSFLQPMYAVVGLALVGLPWLGSVRRYLEPALAAPE